jgi:succinyl-CoA synthetase beta subunit
VQAFELLREQGSPVKLPIVVRLDGNNADLGHEILDSFAATLPAGSIERVETMDDAARRAAELAATGQGQGA